MGAFGSAGFELLSSLGLLVEACFVLVKERLGEGVNRRNIIMINVNQ